MAMAAGLVAFAAHVELQCDELTSLDIQFMIYERQVSSLDKVYSFELLGDPNNINNILRIREILSKRQFRFSQVDRERPVNI